MKLIVQFLKSRTLRRGIYGAAIGLLVGLFILFIRHVEDQASQANQSTSDFHGSNWETASPPARSYQSTRWPTPDDHPSLNSPWTRDPIHQCYLDVANEMLAAGETSEAVKLVSAIKCDNCADELRAALVASIERLTKQSPEDMGLAHKVAKEIANPSLRAPWLARVGNIQLRLGRKDPAAIAFQDAILAAREYEKTELGRRAAEPLVLAIGPATESVQSESRKDKSVFEGQNTWRLVAWISWPIQMVGGFTVFGTIGSILVCKFWDSLSKKANDFVVDRLFGMAGKMLGRSVPATSKGSTSSVAENVEANGSGLVRS
ncbi:MAG TPA: hypothetical protein VK395_36025 [Gemmataceae bacterium]|nr:hypothetical protein [Gemmataceae bacterium]